MPVFRPLKLALILLALLLFEVVPLFNNAALFKDGAIGAKGRAELAGGKDCWARATFVFQRVVEASVEADDSSTRWIVGAAIAAGIGAGSIGGESSVEGGKSCGSGEEAGWEIESCSEGASGSFN